MEPTEKPVFVAHYARRSEGRVVAAIHRRVIADRKRDAKKIARRGLPLGYELVGVTRAKPVDDQPYLPSDT